MVTLRHFVIKCNQQQFHALGVVVFLFLMTNALPSAQSASKDNADDKGICRSVDIRSSVSNFEKLKGCRVVEGNVHILLLDNIATDSYRNISFPELTEITGYLLFYRVDGLETLSRLLPNLAVIRGQNLLFNHAFIVYELSVIQDLGLYSLTNIERGAVYISKNPNLCFSNTIDWDVIVTHGGAEYNVISLNKDDNECGLCPGDEKNINNGLIEGEKESIFRKNCPVAINRPRSKYAPPAGRHLCWNRDHCQKICPAECENRTCSDQLKCCSDDQCLGGCSGSKLDVCKVCRNFTIVKSGKPLCMKKCPPSHNFMYLSRRCVNAEQCQNITKPKGEDRLVEKPHKPFNDSCLLECPVGYTETKTDKRLICMKCVGQCPKKCLGTIVNSIRAAQGFFGCTFIEGSLEIQLRDGNNIVHELYNNLGQITEIEGYLKVSRSYPLISLGFLKNLRIIHGKELDSLKYSLVVKDNSNLQELWDFQNTTKESQLQIRKGRVQFHYNPKLCMFKIDQLVNMVGIKNITEDEIQPKSNGDKIACNVSDLQVSVLLGNHWAQLEWRPFHMEDERHLLGYVVYWMETNRTNISIYESRDACGGDGWNVADVHKVSDVDYIYHPFTKLKAYTKYACYVKTYAIASEPTGAQSDILYFQTLPGIPKHVTSLTAVSNESSVLIMKWDPPAVPNGKISHYKIKLAVREAKSAEQRNYCDDAPDTSPKLPELFPNKINPVEEIESPETDVLQTKMKEKEDEAESAKLFEDELQNLVYIKRVDTDKPSKRNKRSLLQPTESTPADAKDDSISVKDTFYVARNLNHYTEYTVKVRACREYDAHVDNESTACSYDSIVTQRTLPKPGADDVKDVQLDPRTTNQSIGMVRLTWDEPAEPNGMIQTYQIEYKRLNIENVKATVVCIIRQRYIDAGNSYVIKDLPAGNYSLRLRATSSRGEGAYTSYKYFYIPPTTSGSGMQIVIGMTVGIILICLLLAIVWYYFHQHYLQSVPNMKLFASVNPEYVSTAYVPDDWEVPRKKIELLRELGQGSFGMVYEGVAHDVVKGHSQMRCAIKTVNEHATDRERIEFLNEASVMKAFDTVHVVRLLGVVSQGQPTLVIMELMSNGDLKSYLRSHRPEEQDQGNPKKESPPSLRRVLQMAIEIADGMAYLTAKKFVHRDLAARNCMVSDNLTVKIGDFGMTRDIYETDYYRKGTKGLLPVRWMAPESLKDGVFQSSSDVWSYGVVLWEMATLASQPYQGLSNEQVLRYVIDGGVMERPENCPDKLYDLMRLCWQHKATARPTFLELATMLLQDATPEFRQIAFYFSKAGQEALAAQTATAPEEAEATTPLRPANTADDDGFSLDSCSDHDELDEGSTDLENAIRAGGNVSFQGPTYFSASYHDKPESLVSQAANGYLSTRPGNDVNTTQC